MKTRIIKEPVFNVKILFYWDCTTKELTEHFKRKKITFDDSIGLLSQQGACFEIEYKNKNGEIYKDFGIWVERKKDFYSLSHECIHLVKYIFKATGVPFVSKNDEMIATYHTFWLKKLWRLMK